MSRFERTGEIADLQKGVESIRAALETSSSAYPGRAGFLYELGSALRNRFERLGDPADLDDAIDALRQAVPMTRQDPESPRTCQN